LVSPYINRFLQPDTIIPELSNPQSWNRFSYVENNPIAYNDPSGHKRVEDRGSKRGCSDPKYCRNGKPKSYEELAPPKAPKPPKPPKPTGTQQSPGGSIYPSLYVLPGVHDSKLSTTVEENYTGWGGSGEMLYTFNPRPLDYVSGITGIASDFYNPPPGSYPIGIKLDWHGNESGLSIDTIQVRNYSPTAVALQGIRISNGLSAVDKFGPRIPIGRNGEINMSVNTTIPMNRDLTLTIQLMSTGFPPNPYIQIGLPAGTFPPGGCSFPAPVK
jgi:hypothetical protein